MGFFDLFKKKQDPMPEEEGPSPHYAFAHYALRFIALSDPLRFLAIVASPEAKRFIDAVLQDVGEQCGKPAAFGSDDVNIHPVRVKDYPCAIIEMPPPSEVAEAHFTALVALVDTSAEQPPDSKEVSARYFTLEKGMTLDGQPRSVFAEWDMEGHSNYGDGPSPTVEEFAKLIADHL